MQTVREAWVKQSHENLFTDHYGILKLAADATLTRTLVSSKIASYLHLKWAQWVNSILAVIKQLWQSNTITFSDFIWREPEMLTYKIIEESHAKTPKKSGIPLNRGSKKINYKRRFKKLIGKKTEEQRVGSSHQSAEQLRPGLL